MDDLKHLVAAYFYEFWNEYEYPSWEEAVDDFVRRSPDRAARAAKQIDDLIASCSSDHAVAEALWSMGIAYAPAEGERPWLESVRDRIDRALT